jgi:predicted transcriptional regulator of viral defense system
VQRATRAVLSVAGRQHGRISTRQLHDIGWSDDVIAGRVAAGWLVREHRGVYRLAGAPPSAEGRSAAAVLAVSDPLAVVTHRTGLEHHGVLEPVAGAPVHLTSTHHLRSRAGIVVHRALLQPSEVVRIEGLRVATLARCLVDAAATEAVDAVEQAVREAEFLRILDAPALLAASAGRPRADLLRRLAAERLPVVGELREEFERRFARFLLDRRFPLAAVNRRVVLEAPRR